jgi:TetR/AcrR family transcriptional regulator
MTDTEVLSAEQKILQAAEAEFISVGYAGARMQRIADGAGLNKAMLHYYFKSKDQLFERVFFQKFGQFIPGFAARLSESDIPVMLRLEGFVGQYLDILRRDPQLPQFIIGTINQQPELLEKVNFQIGHVVITMLEAEMQKGMIRRVHPHQFVMSLMGMCVFSFLARPMFSSIFALSDEAYDDLVKERHQHIVDYIHRILDPA